MPDDSHPNEFRIAVWQGSCRLGDMEFSLGKIHEALERADDWGTHVLCMPEMLFQAIPRDRLGPNSSRWKKTRPEIIEQLMGEYRKAGYDDSVATAPKRW